MGVLSGIWAFFTGTTIGRYLLLALAVLGAIWYIRWDAVRENDRKWEAKWQTHIMADNLAEERQSVATDQAVAAQAAVAEDLTKRLEAEKAKPPLVVSRTVVKEVIREVEKVVNAACTVPVAAVWLRDIGFYPEYATVARTASPVTAASDSGLAAADVFAADGLALSQCQDFKRAAEFNLSQWDAWWEQNGRVYNEWRALIDQALKERKETSDVRPELEQLDRDRPGAGLRLAGDLGWQEPGQGPPSGGDGGGSRGGDQAGGGQGPGSGEVGLAEVPQAVPAEAEGIGP